MWVHLEACTGVPFLATNIEMALLLPSETEAVIVIRTRAAGEMSVSLPSVWEKPERMPAEVVPTIFVGTVVDVITVPVTLSVKPIWPLGDEDSER